MLHSDGLIDFRSIVRIGPPRNSLEEAYEREAEGNQDVSGSSTKLDTALQHLTDSQFLLVLSSKEIVCLEVRSALHRGGFRADQQFTFGPGG